MVVFAFSFFCVGGGLSIAEQTIDFIVHLSHATTRSVVHSNTTVHSTDPSTVRVRASTFISFFCTVRNIQLISPWWDFLFSGSIVLFRDLFFVSPCLVAGAACNE